MNKYSPRKNVLLALVIGIGILYIARLFYMQVINKEYELIAINNTQRVQTQYPARGLVFDRNGKLLVENQPAYDLLVTPKQVKNFDTTELIQILGIEKETLVKSLAKCRRYSPFKASVLVSQITVDKYAVLQEKLHKYHGFEIQTRTLRKYNVNHSADVFGYIGEVNQAIIERDSNYAMGDYIGISGLEKTYEEQLRGTKGKKILLVDNYNRIKGSYKDGAYDTPAVVGKNLTATLDVDLQEYAYRLMQNKRGAIIAIEPKTGEILLKISSPGYDPQLMIGLERGKNYRKLLLDPNLPLLDRSVAGAYPPGSTFKTLQALVALKEGVITPESRFECHGGYYFGSQHMGCHHHASPLDLRGSLQNSCNPYYVNVWKRVLENNKYPNVRTAYGAWRKEMLNFGLNQKICPDFSNETAGSIPDYNTYDRKFNTKNWRWSYIMSVSIGQGEIAITPLQIANIAATIANRGYYLTPHIIRPTDSIPIKVEKHSVPIDKKYFEIITEGMAMAVSSGTAKRAAMDSLIICGKTGTAENPHGKDHSIFMAFAPKDDPKIAMAVYIENGGFGATYAVPIAGLLLEKYLTGKISDKKKWLEEQMLKADLVTPPQITPELKKNEVKIKSED